MSRCDLRIASRIPCLPSKLPEVLTPQTGSVREVTKTGEIDIAASMEWQANAGFSRKMPAAKARDRIWA